MATTIGLDIGSSAVRAVQVTIGRGHPRLDRIGQVMLPHGAIRDGEIVQPDAVVETLNLLWSRYGFKGRRVALGLANQQVVVRQVDLPYLPEKELRQSLQFQVQDYIPIPVEQAQLDFHVLERYQLDDGREFNRLLLVAAHRTMVDTLLAVAQQAKLEPVLLDLDAFAILRSLAPERLLEGRQGELLVDIGAAVTNVVIHEGGVPRFVRILLMGGNALTEGLMSALGYSHEQAENTKAAMAEAEAGYGTVDNEAARLVTERANRWVDEIRGSLDFYTAQAESVPVTRVVLTGGASQLARLPERLSQALNLPVDRGHPMQQLEIGDVGLSSEQLVEAEPYLAVAVGLALGAKK